MAARPQYGRASVVGLLLHGGYLGGVFYGISLGVPAGVSAVIVSLQPVLTAVLAARVLGERPTARQWLGLAPGVAGVVLGVGDRESTRLNSSHATIPYAPFRL